jgi:hypothetical protein
MEFSMNFGTAKAHPPRSGRDDQNTERSPSMQASVRVGARPRTIWVLLVVLIVAGAGTGVWLNWNRVTGRGPLGFPHAGQDTVGFDGFRVGEVLTFGAVAVRNSGTSVVTLRSATLVGATDSVTVAPVLVAGPERKYVLSTGRGELPSQAEFGVLPVSIDGAKVQPSSNSQDPGVEILVRVIPKDQAIHRFHGLRIEYEYQGRKHTYTDSIGLEICPAMCPEPEH